MKRHTRQRTTGYRRTTILIPEEVADTIATHFPHGTLSRFIVNSLWAIHRLFKADPTRAYDYLTKTQFDPTRTMPASVLDAIVRTFIIFRNIYGSQHTIGEFILFLLKLISGGNIHMRLKDLKNIDELSDTELERIIQDEKTRAEFALIVSKHETIRTEPEGDEDEIRSR